jgi:hypothetical protein
MPDRSLQRRDCHKAAEAALTKPFIDCLTPLPPRRSGVCENLCAGKTLVILFPFAVKKARKDASKDEDEGAESRVLMPGMHLRFDIDSTILGR